MSVQHPCQASASIAPSMHRSSASHDSNDSSDGIVRLNGRTSVLRRVSGSSAPSIARTTTTPGVIHRVVAASASTPPRIKMVLAAAPIMVEAAPPLLPALSTATASVSSISSDRRRSNIPSLVCAFMASLTTGASVYAFGFYGATLKRTLRLTQSQLDTISTSFFFAGLFSWIPGLCADRFGTRFAMSLGAVLGSTSLLLYWAVARQFIPLPHSWLVVALSILGIMVFLSAALITGSVFKIIVSCTATATANDSHAGSRGTAVGIAKGYVGLGAGVYASIFESIRHAGQSDLDFLPMAATFFLLCVLVPAQVLLPRKTTNAVVLLDDLTTPRHFQTLYASLLVMAVGIAYNSLAELQDTTTVLDNESNGRQVTSDGGGSLRATSSPQYGKALVLTSIWLAPIVSLLFLPTRSTTDSENAVPDGASSEPVGRTVSFDMAENGGQVDAVEQHDATTTPPRLAASAPASSPVAIHRTRAPAGRGSFSKHKRSGEAVDPESNHAVVDDDGDEQEQLLLHNELSEGSGGSSNSRRRVSSPSHVATTAGPPLSARESGGADENNFNLVQMILTPSAMLMLWTCIVLVGSGTVETNNLGQMVESLGLPDKVTPASLALFSVAQASSRVLAGAWSESALQWPIKNWCCIDQGVPRPFFLLVAALVAAVAHLILAFSTEKISFVLGTTLTGAAFGMVWPLMVLIVGEVFGPAHVGANYMFFDGVSSAAGTLFLSKFVAQEVYERHIRPVTADDGNGSTVHSGDLFTCYGPECYRDTHLIVSALCISCALSSAVLQYTSRRTYNHHGHRSS
jgi:MFS family permease